MGDKSPNKKETKKPKQPKKPKWSPHGHPASCLSLYLSTHSESFRLTS